jgi:hypothetical protein
MKIINCDFGEFLIYGNYVMGIINKGVVFDKKKYEILLEIFRGHFKDRPFGYISNRIHSYTIDPMMYKNVSNLDDLFAIAVVSNNSISVERSYKIEQFFYKGHFRHYDNLNDAHKWLSPLLSIHEMENKV